MASVFRHLTTSLSIVRRKSLLMHPPAAFLLLTLILSGQTAGAWGAFSHEALLWRLAVLALAYWLLFSAFTAGWFNMIATAVRRDREPFAPPSAAARAMNAAPPASQQSATEDSTPLQNAQAQAAEALSVLKAFFPGVGEFFAPFALGWLAIFAVTAGLGWWTHQHVLATGGYPEALIQGVFQLAQDQSAPGAQTQQALQTFLASRPQAELARLSSVTGLYLLAAAALFAFWWATAFWAPLVIFARRPVAQAYGESLALFFRRAPGLIAVGLLFFGLWLALAIGGQFHPVLMVLALFATLALKTTAITFLFTHVEDALRARGVKSPPDKPTAGAATVKPSS